MWLEKVCILLLYAVTFVVLLFVETSKIEAKPTDGNMLLPRCGLH